MLEFIMEGGIVFSVMYVLTLLLGQLLSVEDEKMPVYRFKTDPYIYTFLMLLIGFCVIGWLSSGCQDCVFGFDFKLIATTFLFAGLIYALFLLEMEKLSVLAVFVFSIVNAFCFIQKDALMATNVIPWQAEVLAVGVFLGLVTYSSKMFIGLSGAFSLMISMMSLGVVLIAYAGGIPWFIGFMGVAMTGVFICIFQYNRQSVKFQLNEGAVMSATFIFCSLLLQGVNEFAAPSMFILTIYMLMELLFGLFKQYALRKKEPDLYLHAFYWQAVERGFSVYGVHVLLIKLCIMNILLALFELYSPNVVTLPVAAVFINCWLLSKVYYADRKMTLKEVNREFVDNVKKEIANLKKHLKKD